MATTNTKVRTSNTIKVFFDGVDVGLIQSVRVSDDYGFEPVGGIGDIHSVENVPTVARHSISAQHVVLKKGTMRSLGIAIENGDDALRGAVFDIAIMDKDGTVIRTYEKCSYTSGTLDFSAHRTVTGSAEFMALDVKGKEA